MGWLTSLYCADSRTLPGHPSDRLPIHPSIHQVVVHKLLGLFSCPEEEEGEGVVGALVTRHLLEADRLAAPPHLELPRIQSRGKINK